MMLVGSFLKSILLSFLLFLAVQKRCQCQVALTNSNTSRIVWANNSQAFTDAVRGLREGEELVIHLPPGQVINMSDPDLFFGPVSSPVSSSNMIIKGDPFSPGRLHLGYLSAFTVSVGVVALACLFIFFWIDYWFCQLQYPANDGCICCMPCKPGALMGLCKVESVHTHARKSRSRGLFFGGCECLHSVGYRCLAFCLLFCLTALYLTWLHADIYGRFIPLACVQCAHFWALQQVTEGFWRSTCLAC